MTPNKFPPAQLSIKLPGYVEIILPLAEKALAEALRPIVEENPVLMRLLESLDNIVDEIRGEE